MKTKKVTIYLNFAITFLSQFFTAVSYRFQTKKKYQSLYSIPITTFFKKKNLEGNRKEKTKNGLSKINIEYSNTIYQTSIFENRLSLYKQTCMPWLMSAIPSHAYFPFLLLGSGFEPLPPYPIFKAAIISNTYMTDKGSWGPRVKRETTQGLLSCCVFCTKICQKVANVFDVNK